MTGAGPDWTLLLLALLDTLEEHMAPEERDLLLRAIGGRIAALAPIPPEDTLSGLEARINERLAAPGWGSVSVSLDSGGPALVLTHEASPVVSTARDAAGLWLGPVLEGMHGGWIAAQPGAEAEVPARIVEAAEGRIVLRYGV